MKMNHWKFRLLGLTLVSLLAVQMLFAQSIATKKMSIEVENVPLEAVMQEIKKKTNYKLFYNSQLLQGRKASVKLTNATVDVILKQAFKGLPLAYTLEENTIVIQEVKRAAKQENKAEFTLQGHVKDEEGEPLIGVNVYSKENRRGSLTDLNGNYQIRVQTGDVIAYSYVGMEEKTIVVGDKALVNVVLKQNVNELQAIEVVSTGYQRITRERSTAAASLVDNKTLVKQLNTDLLSALEGTVAGLNYVKNPNGASADSPILRGVGTFSSEVGTAPLIVLDDMPTEMTLDEINQNDVESITVLKDAAAASIYGARAANGVIVVTTKKAKERGVKVTFNGDWTFQTKPNMSKMNYATTSELIDYETDIYNNEVANYGSEEALFNYYGGIGAGTIRYYSPLYQLYRDRMEGTKTSEQVDAIIGQYRNNDYIEDVKKHLWRTSTTQRYNMSLANSTDKNNSYFSLEFQNTRERVITDGSNRFNAYFKNTFNISKWLTITVGMNGRYQRSVSGESSFTDYSLQPRYARLVDENGNSVTSDYVELSSAYGSGSAVNGLVASQIAANPSLYSVGLNVLESLNEGATTSKTLNLRPFANMQINLYKGLKYNIMFQYELNQVERERYNEQTDYMMRMLSNALVTSPSAGTYKSNLPEGGRYYQYLTRRYNYTFRQQLSYDKTFGSDKKHNINAIGGFEMRQTKTPRTIEQLRYGYNPVTLSNDRINWQDLYSGYTSYIYGTNAYTSGLGLTQSEIIHRYISAYTNVGYTYNNKYNLTGSIRVDQADLFGVDPKYKRRPLWSVGAGWNASREEFMESLTWLNNLKFRLTYGINGNVDQSSSPYLTASWKTDKLYSDVDYLAISTLPNPKLRWEQTATTNFGIDFSVLENRLRGSIEFYNKQSTDLLVTTDLDPTVGALTRVLNNGALENKGIEISLNSQVIQTEDWGFDVGLTFANNKNTVKEVNRSGSTAYSYVGAPGNYFFEGDTYYSLYAYKFSEMVNGYPVFLDENGEPNVTFNEAGVPTSIKNITSADAIVNMGSLNPVYNGSVSLRLRYQSFELGTMFVYAGGNKLRKDVPSLSDDSENHADIVRRWNAEGTGDYPRMFTDYPQTLKSYASTLSTLWQYADVNVKKADYLKMRNINLSYNLPENICKKMKLNSTRITAQVNNIFTWCAAGNGIDPETYSANSGSRGLPSSISYLLGFTTGF